MKRQFELPTAGLGSVFNLAGETGVDPFRVERERWEAAERAKAAAEYQAKMQLTLRQCPGFVGCDPPANNTDQGTIVVEPGRITEAMPWLRRRFHVCEDLELSLDNGLCLKLKPRVRTCAKSGKRLPVNFQKPEQFKLRLDTESETKE